VSNIGWDELLKTRSAVFVMEEEYRMQKSQANLHSATGERAGMACTITRKEMMGTWGTWSFTRMGRL